MKRTTGQDSSGITSFSISKTESSVVPFLSARVADAYEWCEVNTAEKSYMKPNMICCSWWEQNGHHMPTWITGPSASGSEYGTPTSITSEPQESSIFNAFDVVSKSGSPAVMNGMNAVWKFPGLDRPLMQNFYSKNANATLRHGIRQDHSNWRLAIWPPISILSSWYTNFLVQIICIKEHITQNDTLVLHIHIKVVYWCTSCQSWAIQDKIFHCRQVQSAPTMFF